MATIKTGSRTRSINAVNRGDEFKTEEGNIARCEMDSHADTCVAGPNFKILEFTGEQCDVSPYTNDYDPITNVSVVNAVTAFTDESSGETVILRFNQVLWYGNRMKMSLINPNQLRYYGVSVSDDPTDNTRAFGITVTNIVHVPFKMDGTTVYFETRVPTQYELENCKTIPLTDDTVWEPSSVSIANAAVMSLDLPFIEMSERRKISAMSVRNNDHVLPPAESPNDLMPYDDAAFLNRMISNVRVATSYREASISFIGSKDRHSRVNAETVARRFRCGIETAQNTLNTTTQRGVRYAIHPLHRRYRVDHLNLHRRRLADTFYMDTLFSKVKSLNGMECAQLITNGSFTRVYPMESKSSHDIAQALTEFIDDVGVPGTLICDFATEQTGKNTEVMKVVRRNQIRLLLAEKGRGTTQNHRAETEIREIKTKWKTRMRENQVPSRLWDYGLVYISEIQSLLARGPDQRPGIEKILGQTVDISEWLDFDFYERVWYWDHQKTDMNNEQAKIGRWLGIAHRVGSDMTYWLLTQAGHVIARSTVQHITVTDMAIDAIRDRVSAFDNDLAIRMNDENFQLDHPNPVFYLQDDVPFADDAANDNIPPDAEYGDMNQPAKREADEIEFDTFDQYLNSEFLVNNDGETAMARVVKRAKDNNGNPIGKRHPNPLLDTREYECELEDGSLMRYHANVIAENIFAQCDDEGRRHAVLAEIVDHKADKRALTTDNGYVTTKRGRRVPKRTTKGWKILCQWKDGSTDWVDMRYVKDSNPIELAEYAVANRIQEEPAFKWWVPETLRMRNRIIGKVKSRYWKTSHKYGVRLPHSVQEALQIDKETGTDFWWSAIQKELKKVMVAFEYDESTTPEQIREGLAKGKYVGFQEIKCHMIFDVKMDLTRKARFVAGGHMTEPPASITYSSVVSRDSVRIAFLLAALNDLDILACDIGNAYLNAPCRERVWFVAGPEFGSRQGTVIKIVRALYGLKSSGASWRAMFNNSIQDMGFQPSIADPDVYLRAFAKPNGYKYYEYILVYVDDVLIVSHAPEEHLKIIQANYELNPASIGPPNRYLGADVEKVQKPGDPTGREYWSFSARTYVKNAVKNVKLLLQEEGRGLKSTAKTPFPSSSYRPEVDTTDECNSEQSTRFQNLIGVLRWAVELGRLDVYTEVALLSQHLALPRIGHLEAVYHVFAYLAKHETSRIIFDSSDQVPYDPTYHRPDWSAFYDNLEEELPPKMPEPLGKAVTMHVFVDANHAGNVVTRRSHTGILLFIQNSPILWLSRRQNTVETSTFGSEFVAMRTARDLCIAMRYKLRMFGVPIDGPAQVYCDNQGVVKNTSVPESVLSKKHNAINYHAVREAVAAGVLQVHKEDTQTNLADLFTKVLHADRRKELISSILHNF